MTAQQRKIGEHEARAPSIELQAAEKTLATGAAPRSGFMARGFLLTLFLRMLTSSLLIVIPLFVTFSLRVSASSLGYYVLLLWAGNGAGAVIATGLIKKHFASALTGFGILCVSMLGFSFYASSPLGVGSFAFMAGAGVGMAQPFLPALMHLDSGSANPSRGIGYYSVALGAGLISGPVVAWALQSAYAGTRGYSSMFLFLFAVSVAGLVAVLSGIRSVTGRLGPEFGALSLRPKEWVVALRNRKFLHFFNLNLLYSLLLPIVLSYGGVYAGARFGLDVPHIYLLFVAVFLISVAIRGAATRLRKIGKVSLLLLEGSLTASFLAMAFAPMLIVFVAGMLLFSVPHALILPETEYRALNSVENRIVMNSSYAFQASSGMAEVVSPLVAVAVISFAGLTNLFQFMLPLAIISLLYAQFLIQR